MRTTAWICLFLFACRPNPLLYLLSCILCVARKLFSIVLTAILLLNHLFHPFLEFGWWNHVHSCLNIPILFTYRPTLCIVYSPAYGVLLEKISYKDFFVYNQGFHNVPEFRWRGHVPTAWIYQFLFAYRPNPLLYLLSCILCVARNLFSLVITGIFFV